MDRYFIVSYIGTSLDSNRLLTGQINMTSGNGNFLNRELTIKVIEEKSNSVDIVITYLMEVNPTDWKIWTQKS